MDLASQCTAVREKRASVLARGNCHSCTIAASTKCSVAISLNAVQFSFNLNLGECVRCRRRAAGLLLRRALERIPRHRVQRQRSLSGVARLAFLHLRHHAQHDRASATPQYQQQDELHLPQAVGARAQARCGNTFSCAVFLTRKTIICQNRLGTIRRNN